MDTIDKLKEGLLTNRSIAVFRFSSLGDVVLAGAFPVLLDQFLKQNKLTQLNSKIIFFTFPEFSFLVKSNPFITDVVEIPRYRGILGPYKFISKLRQELQNHHCYFIFDLQSSLRTMLALAWINIPNAVFPKRRLRRLLFMLGLPTMGKKPVPIIKRYRDFLQALNLGGNNHPIEIEIDAPVTFPPQRSEVQGLPSKYIAILPSAAHAKKRWPEQYFLQFCKHLEKHGDWKFVVLAGKDDRFCSIFDGHESILNLSGKTNLAQATYVLSQASFVLGNDTGLMHIAESLGIPFLTLFGPTSEFFGFIPHTNVGRTKSISLWCRPCSATGAGSCFRSERYCLTQMTPAQISELVLDQLNGKKN